MSNFKIELKQSNPTPIKIALTPYKGAKGDKGDKGDMGAVTPSLQALADSTKASEAACKNAEDNINAQNEINKILFANALIKEDKGLIINTKTALANVPILEYNIFGNSTQASVPTFDNPVPVVSVGDSGSVRVKINGKNIWDIDKGTKTFSSTQREVYIVTKKAFKTFKNAIITISFDWSANKSINNTGYITLVNPPPIVPIAKSIRYTLTGTSGRQSGIFTNVNGSIRALDMYVDHLVDDEQVVFTNIQIEIGDIATPYEPYTEHEVVIPVSSPLYGGINDSTATYSDNLTIDCINKRAYIARNLDKYVFTGNETSTLVGYSRDGGQLWSFDHTLELLGKRAVKTLSNNLYTQPNGNIYIGEVGCYTGTRLFARLPIAITNPNNYFQAGDYIIYVLATPTTEELPWKDEYKLLAKSPINITCSDNTSTEVSAKYIQDTNIVISNITKAIALLNGGI